MKELFGQQPRVFRNTELIYNNDLAHFMATMGYAAVITEGADQILEARTPNMIYRPPRGEIKILLKNYRMSDDISIRFSDRSWDLWPLTADKFAARIAQLGADADVATSSSITKPSASVTGPKAASSIFFAICQPRRSVRRRRFPHSRPGRRPLPGPRHARRAADGFMGRYRARPVHLAGQRHAIQRSA